MGGAARLGRNPYCPGSMPALPLDLGRILERERRRLFWLSFPVFLLVGGLGLALMALAPTIWWWELGMALALFEAPVVLWLVLWMLTWRHLRPAKALILWTSAFDARRAIQEWQSVDGGTAPTTPLEALSRLGERTDDMARALRLRALMDIGRWDSYDAELASWRPDAPIARVRRQLFTVALAYGDDSVDENGTQAAIESIPDEADRKRALAAFGLWQATRASLSRRDPVGPLAATWRKLGTFNEPSGFGALRALAVVIWGCLGAYLIFGAVTSIVTGQPI
jgi:hypothetical protein